MNNVADHNKVPKKRETGIKDCQYVKRVDLSDESMGVYFFSES